MRETAYFDEASRSVRVPGATISVDSVLSLMSESPSQKSVKSTRSSWIGVGDCRRTRSNSRISGAAAQCTASPPPSFSLLLDAALSRNVSSQAAFCIGCDALAFVADAFHRGKRVYTGLSQPVPELSSAAFCASGTRRDPPVCCASNRHSDSEHPRRECAVSRGRPRLRTRAASELSVVQSVLTTLEVSTSALVADGVMKTS